MGGKFQDITGQTFGSLTILGRDFAYTGKNTRWLYRCACGKEGGTVISNLRSGDSVSCGCRTRSKIGDLNRTHGQAAERSPTYLSWKSMWQRVNDPNLESYKHYGGRGITVCERWKKYENFLVDMGPRPEGMTLERRRVNGNYEPGNCIWASREAQANNQRRVPLYMVDGKLMSRAQAARYWGTTWRDADARLSNTQPYKENDHV